MCRCSLSLSLSLFLSILPEPSRIAASFLSRDPRDSRDLPAELFETRRSGCARAQLCSFAEPIPHRSPGSRLLCSGQACSFNAPLVNYSNSVAIFPQHSDFTKRLPATGGSFASESLHCPPAKMRSSNGCKMARQRFFEILSVCHSFVVRDTTERIFLTCFSVTQRDRAVQISYRTVNTAFGRDIQFTTPYRSFLS